MWRKERVSGAEASREALLVGGEVRSRGRAAARQRSSSQPAAAAAPQGAMLGTPAQVHACCMCARCSRHSSFSRRASRHRVGGIGEASGHGGRQPAAAAGPAHSRSQQRRQARTTVASHLRLVLESLGLSSRGGADGAALLAGRFAAEQAGSGGGTGGARRCGRRPARQGPQGCGSSAGGMASGASLQAGRAACEGTSARAAVGDRRPIATPRIPCI